MIKVKDLAEEIGVHPLTIVRHYINGDIPKPKRDWRKWRYYDEKEANDVRWFFNKKVNI